jgi:hypothetical protein
MVYDLLAPKLQELPGTEHSSKNKKSNNTQLIFINTVALKVCYYQLTFKPKPFISSP